MHIAQFLSGRVSVIAQQVRALDFECLEDRVFSTSSSLTDHFTVIATPSDGFAEELSRVLVCNGIDILGASLSV